MLNKDYTKKINPARTQSAELKTRVLYPDVLRILAIIAVIFLHASAHYMYSAPSTSYGWLLANIINSLTRWCVPVFLMISGVFLLDTDRQFNLKRFYANNVVRLFLAYLFWGFAYSIILTRGNFRETISNIVRGIPHYHLYFILYLLGLYIAVPILRSFVRGATQQDFLYFLCIWFFVNSALPLARMFLKEPLSSFATTFPAAMNLNFFVNYTGFLLLGQYIHRYWDYRHGEKLWYILGLAGGLWTIIGTTILSRTGVLNETFLVYSQVNVILQSIAVFLFVKTYAEKVSFLKRNQKKIVAMSGCVFTVYLCHDMFLIALIRYPISLLYAWTEHSYMIPALAGLVCVFSFSAALLWQFMYKRLKKAFHIKAR